MSDAVITPKAMTAEEVAALKAAWDGLNVGGNVTILPNAMSYEMLDPVTGEWVTWVPWSEPAVPPAEADTPHVVEGNG